MQIARVRLFSLFGAMLFLLNLLTSNVIYHNICILSTLILKNLMYLKSIDELPTPFPLSAFITFHSLSLPSVAFPYLSPPPHLIVRPLSAPPFCPRLAPFCPHLAPLSHHAPAFPRFTLASLLLHNPFVSHIRLSRTIVCAPFFYSLCFTPSIVFTLSHCFTSFVLLPPPLLYSLHCFTPLCFAHSIVLHPFALLSPIVYPLRFIYSHCFAPVFLLPGNLRKPVPGTAKGNVFLIFQRNFAKSP